MSDKKKSTASDKAAAIFGWSVALIVGAIVLGVGIRFAIWIWAGIFS